MSTQSIIAIRDLATRYSYTDLERCIDEQIKTGKNSCLVVNESEEAVALLSKSSYVRELMLKGMSLPEALRELGAKIRRYAFH